MEDIEFPQWALYLHAWKISRGKRPLISVLRLTSPGFCLIFSSISAAVVTCSNNVMHHSPVVPDFSVSVNNHAEERSVSGRLSGFIWFWVCFFHLDEAKPKKEGLTLRISRFRPCLTVCFVFLKFMFLGLLLYGQKMWVKLLITD